MTSIPHYVYQAKTTIELRDAMYRSHLIHRADMSNLNQQRFNNLNYDLADLGVTEINDYDYYSSVDEGTELYDFYMESLS